MEGIMSELNGQMDMSDLIGGAREAGTLAPVAGYDANGALINPEADVYAAVATEDADRLRYLAAGIRSDFDAARERVLHAGMLLLEARGRCPEGRWLQWLREEARVPERTAQESMQLYETFGARELPESISKSHLVELLRAPEADREALMQRAAEEELSTRQLKEEIRALREEYQRAQVSIHDLHVELEDGERTNANLRADLDRAREDREAMAGQRDDAVKRANLQTQKAREAQGEIAKLMAREPERVEVPVERIPDDVAAELERLRAENEALRGAQGRPRSSRVEQFVYLVKRFGAAFGEMDALIGEIRAEDAEKAVECRATLIKALDGLKRRIEA